MGLGENLIFWKKNCGQQRVSCLTKMTIGTEEVGDASMMPWGCFAANNALVELVHCTKWVKK